MSDNLAINGGKKTVPNGLQKPWPPLTGRVWFIAT